MKFSIKKSDGEGQNKPSEAANPPSLGKHAAPTNIFKRGRQHRETQVSKHYETDVSSLENSDISAISEELFGHINAPVTGNAGTAEDQPVRRTQIIQLSSEKKVSRANTKSFFIIVITSMIFISAILGAGYFYLNHNFVVMKGASQGVTQGVQYNFNEYAVTEEPFQSPNIYAGDTVYYTEGNNLRPGFMEKLKRGKVYEVNGNSVKVIPEDSKDIIQLRKSAIFYKNFRNPSDSAQSGEQQPTSETSSTR